MTERMTTLTVFTQESDEEGLAVFKVLSDVCGEMAMVHQSAWVSTHKMNDGLDGDDDHDELYYDEDTLKKVYRAIKDVLPHDKLDAHELANDVLLNLQTVGILFRERRS